MASLKHILKHPVSQHALSAWLAGYIRLVHLTSRRQCVIHPEAEPYMRGDGNAIFAFWHGRMMMMPTINPPRAMHVLISHHSDGLLISRVIRHFKQDTVAGSSSKGGSAAVRNIVRLLKQGDNIGITPDGPRGPNRTVSMGTVTVAALAQKPIIPCSFSASRFKSLRSWDRFMVALPFGKIVFCIGAPLMVKEADETARHTIETAMNALVEQADALQQL